MKTKLIIITLTLITLWKFYQPVNATYNEVKMETVNIVSTERVNAWKIPLIKVRYEVMDTDGRYYIHQMIVENTAPWEESTEMEIITRNNNIINAYPIG